MKKLIFLILLYSNLLFGQEPSMFQLKDENGLSSMTVYQVIQGKDGYLWIGTARGLSRYDGRNFVHVDLSNLLDREIIYLAEDHMGRIWMNNLSGQVAWVDDLRANLLDIEELPEDHLPMRFAFIDSLIHITFTSENQDKDFYKFRLNSMDQIIDGQIICSNMPTSKIRHIGNNGKTHLEKVAFIDDRLCFTYYQRDSLNMECYYVNTSKTQIRSSLFNLHYIDKKERYYFTNNDQVLRFDKQNSRIEFIYDCSKNQINKCYVIDSKIWLLTKNGIILIDSESLEKESTLLKGKNTNSLHTDLEDNIWIATASHGIYIMYNKDPKSYKPENSPLPKSDVRSLHYDFKNDFLYIGMSGGYISKFNYNTENITNYKLELSGRVMSIMEDHNQKIWLALDDGVVYYDPDKEEIGYTWIQNASKVLFEDSKNQFWHGSSSQLSKWEDTGKLLKKQPKNPLILAKRIASIIEDCENKHWIGTKDGLYVSQNDSLQLFYLDENSKTYSISSIAQSMDSSIWVATANEGLIQIKNDKVIRHYSSQDGLTSNNCLSLYSHENDLIIGTDNGVSIIDIETKEVSQIYTRDGLPSGEINCVTTNGKKIWMGTPKGLVVMDREDVPKHRRLPPIRISGLKVNGGSQSFEENLTFTHKQNSVDIEYIGLDIKSNQNESYIYRLKGLNDNEWFSTPSRIARFHTLPPGDYEFQVKTVSDVGQESLNSANFKFTIKRPWWKSIWFYVSSALFSIIFIGSIIYWRVNEKLNREKVENELKDRIQNLKSEALKSQMNPHFIYNSLNAIQDFFVTHDEESALIYMSKFATMIRQIFDYSSRDTITVKEEIEFLKLYLELEKLRFGDRVEMIFEIDESLNYRTSELEIPPLLLQPVIENVFKHGLMHKLKGGVVQIHFGLQGDQVKCVIEDNGIGRKASNKMKRWYQKNRKYSGLQAVEERLAIWKNKLDTKLFEIIDLENSSGDALGTRIIIVM